MKYVTIFKHFIYSGADKLSALLCSCAGAMEKLFAPLLSRTPALCRFFRQLKPEWLFVLLCFVSVLSQIDVVSATGAARIAVMVIWCLVFIVVAAKATLQAGKKTWALLCPILLFDLLILCFGLFKRRLGVYMASPLVYAANLSAFVFLTGAFFGKISKPDLILSGAKAYIFCAVLITVYTVITTFSDVGFSSYLYAYSRKNSLAPVIVTAICCVLFLKPFQQKALLSPCLILFGTFLALLKSRANLIGLAVVLVVWYICAAKSKQSRLQVLLNLAAVAFLVITISPLRELLIDNILLNHRADLGINGITSGRAEQISSFVTDFDGNLDPFTGIGYMYVEMLPLAAILSYGLLGAVPLLLFALVPLFSARFAKKSGAPAACALFLFSLSLAFLLNGVFEERAPFGPGVTYFMLWFTSGFFVSRSDQDTITKMAIR